MKSNIQLQGLISELKKHANEHDAALWKRIALELEKPTRHRRVVNLSKIEHYAKDGEILLIPGKVLGTGEIKRKISVSSYDISVQALDKLKKSNCSYFTLSELMKENPKANKVRIIG